MGNYNQWRHSQDYRADIRMRSHRLLRLDKTSLLQVVKGLLSSVCEYQVKAYLIFTDLVQLQLDEVKRLAELLNL